jgi:hypothetical protein
MSFELLTQMLGSKVHPKPRHEGSEGGYRYSSTLVFNLGPRRGWFVNSTLRSLYSLGKRPGTHGTGDWVGPRAVLEGCGRPRTTRIRSPYRSARSESQLLSNL